MLPDFSRFISPLKNNLKVGYDRFLLHHSNSTSTIKIILIIVKATLHRGNVTEGVIILSSIYFRMLRSRPIGFTLIKS